MAKNSAAQYEVVAVDYEDGVQWRLWHWQQQRSTVLKNKARRW
jgi:DNA/RNA-binding domain of Phe-tRNA-synthetase-like protein